MANRSKWTDEEVEAEIDRLSGSELVRLARKEHHLKYKRRQYMWTLQYLEARGRQLTSMGITRENMASVLFGEQETDSTDADDTDE